MIGEYFLLEVIVKFYVFYLDIIIELIIENIVKIVDKVEFF